MPFKRISNLSCWASHAVHKNRPRNSGGERFGTFVWRFFIFSRRTIFPQCPQSPLCTITSITLVDVRLLTATPIPSPARAFSCAASCSLIGTGRRFRRSRHGHSTSHPVILIYGVMLRRVWDETTFRWHIGWATSIICEQKLQRQSD